MVLNKNNFLRWEGGFTPKAFSNVAVNDSVNMVYNAGSVVIYPLTNDTSTFGINANSLVFTLQNNTVTPASWNPTTGAITFYPPAGAGVGTRTIKYKWQDTEGNWSNEATVTINLTARVQAWRGHPDSYACVAPLDGTANYAQLEKYYTDNNTLVSPLTLKDNAPGDPDYIAPVADGSCAAISYKQWDVAMAATPNLSCASGAYISFYTNSGVIYLTNGTNVWSDSAKTTPAANGFYQVYGSGRTYEVYAGKINGFYNCP